MKPFTHLISSLAPIVAVAAAPPLVARADLPPNETVRYLIRATADPQSPVVLAVWIELEAQDTDGNKQIGWSPVAVDIAELDGEGEFLESWQDDAASFDTSDGLWWVTHDDVAHPEVSEFVDPPYLAGAAASNTPSNEPLNYELEGGTVGQSPPFTPTAYLNHAFVRRNAPQPIETGEDEPVETDDGNGPPA